MNRWAALLLPWIAAATACPQGTTAMSNDALLARIEAIDPTHASTMRENPTTFRTEQAPFYKRFRVVRARIQLRHKPVDLAYADSGTELLPLSTLQAIQEVNFKEGLQLTEKSVADYVRLVVELTGPTTKLALVEQAGQVRWLPNVEKDADKAKVKQAAAERLHPVQVSLAPGAFVVTFTALKDRALVEQTWRVLPDGRVAVERDTVVVDKLPVPYTM